MRVAIDGDMITVRGANDTLMFIWMLLIVPISIIGVATAALLLLAGHPSTGLKFLLWPMLFVFVALPVLMFRSLRESRSGCVSICRSNYTVTITSKSKNEKRFVGVFQKILVQPVRAPRSMDVYHAYIVGDGGKCRLGIVATTKDDLIRKMGQVVRFLGVPVEVAEQPISVFETVFEKKA